MLRISSSFIAVAALVAIGACGSPVLEPFSDAPIANQTRPGGAQSHEDAPLTPAPRSVQTVGIITEAPSQRGPVTFLIERYPDRPLAPGAGTATSGDKYHVTVTEDTRIRRRASSGESRPANRADIVVGLRAEVWFVGPIRESYPMQGTAGRIMIFDP